ncbi:hypothetical protein DINM_001912 [Dirofilaria immitis]|nr:hypothetical protein [Dirofilaria immitis]
MLGIDKIHRGTIEAKFPFHDDEAADLLAELLASKADINKMQIFQILTLINNTQRQMIKTPYKIKYKRDLLIDLINGLPGDFKEIILALMETPTKYDTLQLAKAMNEKDTNESLLIEILCLRTGLELTAIKNEYQIIIGNKLENDIAKHTNGDLKDILMIIIQKPITTNDDIVDMEKIKQEVKKILGEKKKIDKTSMKSIIASLPSYQLNILVAEYATITGHHIEQDIENPNGTRNSDLIRLIISRSEIDLATISETYTKNYKKKLIEVINAQCNGSYRDCLINIIKGNMKI